MVITASEARSSLIASIRQGDDDHDDHDAVEIVSRHGNAVLVCAEHYAALREGAYLLRSPANARRLLESYGNALAGFGRERELVGPDTGEGG